MREIKFRAWDGKEMRRVFYLAADGIRKKPEWEVMQYTGLKDKNGEEIYEGDIVLDEGWTPSMNKKEIVKFEEGGMYPFAIAGWECTISSEECEVIGNIYENPKLINKPLANSGGQENDGGLTIEDATIIVE